MATNALGRNVSRWQEAAEPGPLYALAERYRVVRGFSELLCEPLATEDYVIQTMAEASPTRWHLAHVTWFFETLVLRRVYPGYRPLNEQYHYLFNSYYNTLGDQWPRPRRGLLSRPTVKEVYEYRAYVDRHVLALIKNILHRDANVFLELYQCVLLLLIFFILSNDLGDVE